MRVKTIASYAILVGLLALSASGLHAQTLAQKKPEAYALGVSLGFASFQMQVASNQKVGNHPGYWEALGSLSRAVDFARSISAAKDAPANLPDPTRLDGMVKSGRNTLEQTDENQLSTARSQYEEIVAFRSSYAAILSKTSADLTNAYNLGVNLAIAETQTTAGEPARTIVYQSLTNARTAAQALKLDLAELNVCIEMAGGNTSLEETRKRISSVRTTYQSLL